MKPRVGKAFQDLSANSFPLRVNLDVAVPSVYCPVTDAIGNVEIAKNGVEMFLKGILAS